MKWKYRQDSPDEESDAAYDSDKSAATARRRAQASQPRGFKTTSVTRKDALDDDEYTETVSAHQLKCRACKKTIKLHPTRAYDTQHWDQHKKKCPAITGVKIVRSGVKTKEHVVSSCLV